MKAKVNRPYVNGRPLPKLGQNIGMFALGATTGSICALLFAPSSGQVTRRRIGNQFRQTQRLLAKKAGYLKEAATEKLGETREWLVDRVINGNGKHLLRHRVVSHS